MGKYILPFFVVFFFEGDLAYASSHSVVNETLNDIEIKPSHHKMKLVGTANFKFLWWDIYQSFLYSPNGRYDNDSSELIFEITYRKSFSQKDLITETISQWKHLNIDEKDYLKFIDDLQSIWPNIRSSDVLTFIVINEKSYFYHNDSFRGVIKDKNFPSLFLSIWLSPNTSQPFLRAKLLGEEELTL